MKQALGVYLMIAGILMGIYLLFGVYVPSRLPGAYLSPIISPAVNAYVQEPEINTIVVNTPEVKPVEAKNAILNIEKETTTENLLLAENKYERPKKAEEEAPQQEALFYVPAGLKKEVAFWTDIYSKYTNDQAVMHDPEDLGKIYSVIKLPHCEEPPRKECLHAREDAIKEERDRLKKKLDPFDKKVLIVRAQAGQRDKFQEAIKKSKAYLPKIENVFEGYGIPTEISRLPFVESMFNNQARSRSGAGGIWQLMRGSARILGLKVSNSVDERFDPVKATQAAARHLKRDYNRLGRWDLAVNAYNTGPSRMADAVSRLGTKNIVKIIKDYDHSAYGFAARNFYPCFLAALNVYEKRDVYFPERAQQ